jgi:hypothetical protein
MRSAHHAGVAQNLWFVNLDRGGHAASIARRKRLAAKI